MLSITKKVTQDDIENKYAIEACINLQDLKRIKNISQDCIVTISYSIFYKPQLINNRLTKLHINTFSNYLTFYSSYYSKFENEYPEAIKILKNSGHLLFCYLLKEDLKQGLIKNKDVVSLEASGLKDTSESMIGLVNYYQRVGFSPIETNQEKLDIEVSENYVPMVSTVGKILDNCFKTPSNPELLETLESFFTSSYGFQKDDNKSCNISSLCKEELVIEDMLYLMDIDKEFLNYALEKLNSGKRSKGSIINKKIYTYNMDTNSKKNITFFDIIPEDNFPSVIGLPTIPKYFKNFFLVTKRGILCIRPYAVKREDIITSKMNFNKSFTVTKHGYTIHYKTWEDLKKCL